MPHEHEHERSHEPASPAKPAGAVADDSSWLHIILQKALEGGASDVHLMAGEVPRLRIAGLMQRLEGAAPISGAEIDDMLRTITPHDRHAALDAGREVDFSYELKDCCRFRVNTFQERRGTAVAFRVLAERPPTIESLHMPADIARCVHAAEGLILFAGPAGAGKTTTLSAVLQEFCNRRTARLITLEDPIESRLTPNRAWVEQRELGRHFRSFEAGVREALDAGPDALAIGELRDLETIRLALVAAETGTLVLATIHAYDVTRAIGRLVDAFPPEDRHAVRSSLADSLRMVVAQTLVREARGGVRRPAVEVAHGCTSLSALVREGKEHEVPTLIESSRGRGMRTLDDSIIDLVHTGTIDVDEALFFAVHRETVAKRIERMRA